MLCGVKLKSASELKYKCLLKCNLDRNHYFLYSVLTFNKYSSFALKGNEWLLNLDIRFGYYVVYVFTIQIVSVTRNTAESLHVHTDRQWAEHSLARPPPVSQFQIAASLGLGKETHGYI